MTNQAPRALTWKNKLLDMPLFGLDTTWDLGLNKKI